jgi:hypothetical protein
MHVRSGRSPKATITGQCMAINNAVVAAHPLSSPVVPACSNLMKKVVFFFGSFLNKITEDRLLSIFHLKKLRNKKYYCPSKMQEKSSSVKSSLSSLTNYGDTFTSNPNCNWNCQVMDQTYFVLKRFPTIAGANTTEKLSEKLRPKTMRSDRDLVSFRLGIQNIVYYTRPNSKALLSLITYKQIRSKYKKNSIRYNF